MKFTTCPDFLGFLKNKKSYLFFLPLLLLIACEEDVNNSDAYGNFEANELLVSSEANGRILKLDVEEGQELKANQLVAIIDTTTLYLQKLQLLARIETLGGKRQDAQPQINVFEEQKNVLLKEKKRVEALLEDKAATPKQLDDINGQLQILDKKIAATSAQTSTINRGVLVERKPLVAQIRSIEDQIRRCYVYNPIDGRVLLKLAEPSEMTAMGKALYKIADTENMLLRAYVSGDQLAQIKIGQEVIVLIDESTDTNRKMKGTISWISEKAEFTPKIIQTKEERVNLVYAMKIAVKNDGAIKIGMPAEVLFSERSDSTMIQ